jgi:VanZ family protein
MSEASPSQSLIPPTAVTGSPRAYAVVLLIVVAFILYGSLFPFEYYERYYPGGPFVYLLSTWHDWDGRGDLLSNILLYLPFGFFCTAALPGRLPGPLRAVLATLAGTLLAGCIEITQFHDVGRVTSMGDVDANAIGSALGAAAAAAIGGAMCWPFIAELAAHPAASLLLAMFFGYRLYPYVPMIDLHKYWHAVRPMLLAPSLPPGELTRYIITWLFIAVIVHSLYGFRRFLLVFPALCGAEFLGRILVIGADLKLNDIVSAVIAFGLWTYLLRAMPGRFAVVAVLFCGMVTAERLEPFTFTMAPHAFGWIPFAGFMSGSMGVAMQAFCQKFYEYGGLIWLLNRTGLPLPVGTGMTTVLLLLTSIAECWLPGRSAEVTDAIMALVIGYAFSVLRASARDRVQSPAAEPLTAGAPLTAAAEEHARLTAAILGQHGIAAPMPHRRGRKYAPYVPPRLRG